MMSDRKRVDVIIIGGGPVGSCFAGQMGLPGYRVHVFERRKRNDVGKEPGFLHFDVPCCSQLSIPRPGVYDFSLGHPTTNTMPAARSS